MKLSTSEYIIFDVETTGLSPANGDRMIEFAAQRIKNGKTVDTFSSLLKPKNEFKLGGQSIHNITEEMLDGAPAPEEILPDLIDFIGGGCLVGHNVKFDLDFLCYELSLISRKLKAETPALDTLKMSKHFSPHLSRHTLANVALCFGIKINEAHRAAADVETTAKVFKHFIRLAEEQKIDSLKMFHEYFGVQKPNYKIEAAEQTMLF